MPGLSTGFGVAVLALGLVRAGCSIVTPQPAAGEPVPAVGLSYSQDDPVSGLLTVSATPSDFAPAQVEFLVDGVTEAVDDSSPFEVTIDTASLPDGTHVLGAVGSDGVSSVTRLEFFVTRNRPNFVVVLLDDLDETTTSYRDALPQTMSLIADVGMTFTNAFAPAPVCCPARASILTGNYPHNTGVLYNTPPDGGYTAFRGGAEVDTVATRLQAEGYRTAMIGKYLNGYEAHLEDIPPGWDEWFGLGLNAYAGFYYQASDNGVRRGYGYTDESYQTDVLRRRALDFLDAMASDSTRRFFVHLSPTTPHNPMPPAPRHANHPWIDDPLPTRPNFDEADVADKPTWLRDGLPPIDQAELDRLTNEHRNRMGSLLAVDEMVAAVVGHLQASGELANTYLVFASDNGYNLGAHRVPDKSAPYDESIRVPMLIAGPSVPAATEPRFVSHLDIAPTILDLASAPHADLDGASLVPLFEGSPPWRSDVLVELRGYLHTFDDVQATIAAGEQMFVPTFRGIRSEQWLYVEWYGGDVHEYELYDMAVDPYQLDNLLATPEGAAEHATTTVTLQARLEALAACAGASCRN